MMNGYFGRIMVGVSTAIALYFIVATYERAGQILERQAAAKRSITSHIPNKEGEPSFDLQTVPLPGESETAYFDRVIREAKEFQVQLQRGN